MRNLVLLQELRAFLLGDPHETAKAGQILDKLALDPYLGTAYAITRDSKEIIGFAPFNDYQSRINFCVHVGEVIPPESAIVAAQFVPDLGAVCYALASGELVVFHTETQEAECVGFIDSEIRAMSWSPDYELLILVTGNGTILSMTQEWDIVAEVPVQEQQAAPLNAEGAALPSISWRGDGNYFAVNTLDPDGERRIRVFDRSLALDSVSTPTPNLEEYSCWRPSGSSIASSQQKANKHDIIFFERNGLRLDRMDLTIRDDAKVLAMQWNADSDILAVGLELLGASREKKVKQQRLFSFIRSPTIIGT